MRDTKNTTGQEEIFSRIIFESNKADSILDLIRKNIRLVIDFFGLSGGAIYFLEDNSANLFINFDLSATFIKDFTSISSSSFIFKDVFEDKECSVFYRKKKGADPLLAKNKEYGALVAVPIFYHRRVIGCYIVAGKHHEKFSKKDLDLMLLAGKEIGSFLEQIISDLSIKKEKQNFKSFFDSMNDLVFVLDENLNILEVNHFASRRLFYARAQILRKHIFHFFLEEEVPRLEEYLSSGGTELGPFFSYLKEKDGDKVSIEFSIVKGTWNDKDAFFFIAKDISKAKEVESRLEEREVIHTSLMSNISNYVVICSNKGIVRYVNKSAERMFKYKDFRFGKRNILDFVIGNSKTIKESLLSGSLPDQELRIRDRDGEAYDVIVSGSAIDYDKERAILLIMTDITKRKIAEDIACQRTSELENSQKALINVLEDIKEEKDKVLALAQDLEKFRLAVENTSDHIVITDSDGILLYANKGAEEMTGFSVEEIIGKKCGGKDTWGGMMPASFYEGLWNTIKKERKSFRGEIINRRKDGAEYVAMASISPIMDKEKRVQFFVGIERDITKDKEIDRAKSEFVSLASHQLRTPLSIINWYTELLMSEDSGELNQEQKSYIKEIIGGNKRMIDLVGALLNVSRIEMGTFAINPHRVSAVKVAESILKELFIKFESREVDLDFNYDKDLPIISLDPKLFGIIVDNLVGNAIKYTPDGGRVVFSIRRDGKDMIMMISDTGYGIANKDKSKIFTKLYRGENIQEKVADGNGLGLYIVKAIIDQSGGAIEFESEEGKGTTFLVRFPLSGMKKKVGNKEIS